MKPRHVLGLVLALGAVSGCSGGATPAALVAGGGKPVTITFWHSWSQPHEVQAINDDLVRFHRLHPNITVTTTASVTDDKMLAAVGGGGGPDVVTSFTTSAVGQFCSSGDWLDLRSFLHGSSINIKRVFPRTVMDYTQFAGRRCALPLLADSFGLYYNRDMFAAAGITGPPHTLSELRQDAVKLTAYNPDGSLKVAGFMPVLDTYEATPYRLVGMFQPQYVDGRGHSNLATDPAVTLFFDWQRGMVEALGGYRRLDAFHAGFGDEFTQNAFEAGKIAMMFDGEWRTTNMTEDKVPFGYGTAPFPVPDDRTDTYGSGYIAGTVIGIPKTSRQQAAAWELVKYLTTDTEGLVSFADALHNVPSTFQSLAASNLRKDPHFATFLDVFGNPDSNTTPNSTSGNAMDAFDQADYRWQAGQIADLRSALVGADRQIDAVLAH